MYQRILVPIDLSDTDLAAPAIDAALELVRASGGAIRIVNVLALTPVMLAEYVPPDFDAQQRKAAEMRLPPLCARANATVQVFPAWCAKAASTTRCWRKPPNSTPI